MKIVDRGASKEKATRLFWFFVAALLLALVLAASLSGAARFLPTAWPELQNLFSSGTSSSDLPALTIDMAFADYDQILDQRSQALAAGVVLLDDQDFAEADISFGDETVPVEMRLQQGPAVHLGEEEKWNYEVRTRGDRSLAGMERFHLIDPADNNWWYEKAFGEALRREGLLAGRYEFVRLFLNGDYRGVYAVQEGFGPELLAANNNPPGVIVEFDARKLWEAIEYFGGSYEEAVADPVTNLGSADFQFFEVDTFRDAAVADDPVLSAQKDTAIGLLRGLQSGELAAAEVFDVEKYGRFLALADLWAASDATQLTNLRYYFNPSTERLEPIAFNANPFGTTDRLAMTATFEDAAIQAAYLRAAERMAQADYLAELSEAFEAEFETVRRQLDGEAERPLPWDQLAQRQVDMRRSLAPLQPVFAYLGPPTLAQEGVIQIDVANVLNLPVEVVGFDISGATFMPADPAWIKSGQENLMGDPQESVMLLAGSGQPAPVLGYVRFYLPLTAVQAQDAELDYLQELEIQVATRLLGLDEVQMTTARPGYPQSLPLVPTAEPGT